MRQGIDGFPIVIFWNNGTDVIFMGKYNWNNDKSTEETFGFQEGDESWEEERPFAYNSEGHASASAPADKKELYLLIEGPDMSALDKELAAMLDYAKNHAKPETDIVGIFRDRIFECVRNEIANQT